MVVVAIVAMLSRRNPVRMVVLHPRMIVPDPPIAIVPRVMVVVVAVHHYRRWWRVDIWRRRLIRIRSWFVPMSAVKTGLE
jgi:hypothetical protein